MTAMIDITSSILSGPNDLDATAAGNDGTPGNRAGADASPGNRAGAAEAPGSATTRPPAAATTGATGSAVTDITGLRERIDEIDSAIIQLWQERATISAEVGRVRIASGGTRLVLSREREIVDRFRDALGADGVQLALLILRAGRGPL